MAVQNSANANTIPLLRGLTNALFEDSAIVAQDAGRTLPLLYGTVMTKDPVTSLWEPYTDVDATDGTEFPRGILLMTIEAAQLVAGNVGDLPMLIKGDVDAQQMVFENSVTLTDVIATDNVQVGDFLREVGLFPVSTVNTEEHQPLP